MDTNNETQRMKEDDVTDAEKGAVRWVPVKSIWYLSHLLVALGGGVFYFSWSAFAVFVLSKRRAVVEVVIQAV